MARLNKNITTKARLAETLRAYDALVDARINKHRRVTDEALADAMRKTSDLLVKLMAEQRALFESAKDPGKAGPVEHAFPEFEIDKNGSRIRFQRKDKSWSPWLNLAPNVSVGIPETINATIAGAVALDTSTLTALELVGVKGGDGTTLAGALNPVPVTPTNFPLVNPSLLENATTALIPDGWFTQNFGAYVAAESAWQAPAAIGANATILAQFITGDAGHYHFRFEAKRNSGTGTVLARIEFYNSASVLISGVSAAASSGNPADYNGQTVQAISPAGTAYVLLIARASTAGDVWRLRRTDLQYSPLAATNSAGALQSIPVNLRADALPAVDVADDCQAMEAQHVTLSASTDTTLTFAGGAARIIRVVNWDTANVVLVKDGAIATDVDASATRVGFAPASSVPNTRTFPYKKATIHLRSAAASVVTVEGFR